jgi:hypothetical protein
MILQKECPSGVRQHSPKGQTSSDPARPERNELTPFLDRYARGKLFQDYVSAYVRDNALRTDFDGLADKLEKCGSWIRLREYLKTGKVKLAAGNFCDCHLLCVLCAAARSRYLLARYIPAVWSSHREKVRHFMLTLTWPPPVRSGGEPLQRGAASTADEVEDLKHSLSVGETALRKLWARKKTRGSGPFKHVLGIVASVEVTRGPAGWHPHLHCIVTLPAGQILDYRPKSELRLEWKRMTGGTQIDVSPELKSPADLVEVFKYAFKPLEVGESGGIDKKGLEWRLLSFLALRGRRLVRSYGCYHSIKPDVVPSQENAIEQFESGAFIEWLAYWDKQARSYNAFTI